MSNNKFINKLCFLKPKNKTTNLPVDVLAPDSMSWFSFEKNDLFFVLDYNSRYGIENIRHFFTIKILIKNKIGYIHDCWLNHLEIIE